MYLEQILNLRVWVRDVVSLINERVNKVLSILNTIGSSHKRRDMFEQIKNQYVSNFLFSCVDIDKRCSSAFIMLRNTPKYNHRLMEVVAGVREPQNHLIPDYLLEEKN